MRNFNTLKSNRRKETAVAAVGVVAVTSLLAGCEGGKATGRDVVTAEVVGEKLEVSDRPEVVESSSVDYMRAKECHIDLMKEWIRDAENLPEDHNIGDKDKTYEESKSGILHAYSDGAAGYRLNLGEAKDAHDTSVGTLTFYGVIMDQQNIPLVSAIDGKTLAVEGQTYMEELSGLATAKVYLNPGETPKEAFLKSTPSQIQFDDTQTILLEAQRGVGSALQQFNGELALGQSVESAYTVDEYCEAADMFKSRLD